ncbi:MAG: hypothetical protein SFU56_17210 [Capsulimonadales bacterium]|nr:hypothetical protein [Capsulimonadales bacterium]
MRFFAIIALGVLLMSGVESAEAQNAPKKTEWNGREAFLLTDGRTEAVIVPSLSSRLMTYRMVGGTNALWNAPSGTVFPPGEWANWGGEKVWPALQSAWPLFGPGWPPHPTYDGMPHRTEVVPGGILRTVGPVMEGFGVRATREFRLDPATGELVITTVLKKETGEPRQIAAWNVVQLPQPDVIYLPVNPDSPYKNGGYWFGGKTPKEAHPTEIGEDRLLVYRPTPTGGYKFGIDAPRSVAAGVKGDRAIILRSEKKDAPYPEGAEGSGFPLTVWNNGADSAPARYNEIEVMSPLTAMKQGETLTHVLRLRLLRLPNADPLSAASREAVAAALK